MISPPTTIIPVVTNVSHATRPVGSSVRIASRTESEIWSAILSGWPSVTDSDVNRYSLSESCVMELMAPLRIFRAVCDERSFAVTPLTAPKRAMSGSIAR